MLHRKKVKKNEYEVPAEVAVQVVQQYLIPMFEQDNRDKNQQKRDKVFNKAITKCTDKSSKLPSLNGSNEELSERSYICQPADGTVFGEFKLSEKLSKELKITKQDLAVTKQNLQDLGQSLAGIHLDLEQAKMSELQAQTDLIMLQSLYDANLNKFANLESELENYKFKCQKYEQLLEKQQNLRQKFGEELYQEKQKADKLQNSSTELENSNSILRMENEIMGERLKHLYNAISNLNNQAFNETNLSVEFR